MGDLNNWNFISAAYATGLIVMGGYIGWATREFLRLSKILTTLNDHDSGAHL